MTVIRVMIFFMGTCELNTSCSPEAVRHTAKEKETALFRGSPFLIINCVYFINVGSTNLQNTLYSTHRYESMNEFEQLENFLTPLDWYGNEVIPDTAVPFTILKPAICSL